MRYVEYNEYTNSISSGLGVGYDIITVVLFYIQTKNSVSLPI